MSVFRFSLTGYFTGFGIEHGVFVVVCFLLFEYVTSDVGTGFEGNLSDFGEAFSPRVFQYF